MYIETPNPPRVGYGRICFRIEIVFRRLGNVGICDACTEMRIKCRDYLIWRGNPCGTRENVEVYPHWRNEGMCGCVQRSLLLKITTDHVKGYIHNITKKLYRFFFRT